MGSILSYFVRTVPGVLTMREAGKDRKPGVLKDNKSTMHMALIAVEKLRTGKIHFSTQLQCGLGTTAQQMKQKVVDQMHDYHLEIKVDEENHFVQPKYTWYGKTGNDDLIVAIMMIFYWDEFFREAEGRSDYDAFKRQIISVEK
jgi:hypothetical protein